MTTKPHSDRAVNDDTAPTALAAITVGFGGVIVTWILAWVLHLPGIDAPAGVTLPILLIGLLAAYLLLLRAHPAPGRMKTALIASAITGVVNLLIVGSLAAEQPESTDQMAEYANRLRSEAWLIIPGSILLCLIAGAIAGKLARRGKVHLTTPAGWLARFGLITVFIYLPLITVGGAVTSTESGLAVPDAVTSYGALSVLFPFELMSEPRIFIEHSHRLFGTLAGLTTIVLTVCVFVFEPRKLPRVLAVLLLASVCLQGYMGIKRVSEMNTAIALVHAVFGTVVLALAGVLAASLTPTWRELADRAERRVAARKAVWFGIAMTAAVFIQIGLGAATRHLDRMTPPSPGASHARLTHVIFAFAVMFIVIVAGSMAIRAGKIGTGINTVRRLGVGLHALVTYQFIQGWVTLALVTTRDEQPVVPTPDELPEAPPIRALEALVTTSHQATGALLLLLAAVTTAWLLRAAAPQETPVAAAPAGS